MIGQTLGHYRVLEQIGAGGMGLVFRAHDTRLGRKVALKVLPPEAARDPTRRKRFEQEARAAAALVHPGIATVFELEEAEDELYIVFEYVPGQTLRTLVQPGGVERDLLLDIAVDIAEALEAAHAAGVVHRDLKPENVMRTPDGGCKVLDFGLARFEALPQNSSTATQLTHPGMVVGTVAYMSPEQLEGREVDFRSDLFSFGTLLYELATGIQPFQGATTASTIAAVMTAEPPPLRERNPLQPPELDRIVRKCLRKRRNERYQSTRDLLVDLKQLRRDSSGETRATPPSTAPTMVGAAGEDSLLRAIGSRVGLTPRRWWEMHQLFVILVYTPVALYLALKASVLLSETTSTALAANWHGWRALVEAIASGSMVAIWKSAGLPFFVLLVLLLVAAFAIRLYCIVLPMFMPVRLESDVLRLRPALRLFDSVIASQFGFAGILLVQIGQGIVLGSILMALGLVTLFAIFNVENVIVRAAFPQAFAEAAERAKPKRDRRFTQVAAAQGVMLWMYFLMLLFAAGFGRDIINAGLLSGTPARQMAYILAVPVLTAMLVSSAALVVRSLQGSRQALRVFLRLFPGYWLLGQAFSMPAAWMTLNLEGHPQFAGPALIALALALPMAALPFYQRRLARQLLRESGELMEEKNTKPALSRFRSPQGWWLVHTWVNLLILVPWVAYWGWLTRQYAGQFSRVVFLAQVLLLGAEWSIRFVLINTWAWNRPGLPEQCKRLEQPVLYVGLGIIATMLVQAGMAAMKDDLGFGAAIGALAMGGLFSVLYIEKAIVAPGS